MHQLSLVAVQWGICLLLCCERAILYSSVIRLTGCLLQTPFKMFEVRSYSYFTSDGHQSSCRAHSETCDLILLPVGRFLSQSCCLVSVGCPLWREAGLQFAVQSLSGPSRAEPVTILHCLTWYPTPYLEGQVPICIFPMNRVAQLYARTRENS
jgi:hypothetical protein